MRGGSGSIGLVHAPSMVRARMDKIIIVFFIFSPHCLSYYVVYALSYINTSMTLNLLEVTKHFNSITP